MEINLTSMLVIVAVFFCGCLFGYFSFQKNVETNFVKKYKAGEFIVDTVQTSVWSNEPNTYMKTTEHLDLVISRPYALYEIKWVRDSKDAK